MLVALVPVAIIRLANTGSIVPDGTVKVTAAESSTAIMAISPAPPTHTALTPVNTVELLGVTAVSFEAGNNAPGLVGVKSGINHLKNGGGLLPPLVMLP
jgi:hypothetical protein